MAETGDLFPNPADTKVHKTAATRHRKEAVQLERQVNATSTPTELVDLIMEIIRQHYRRGEKLIKFAVRVPVTNFGAWAQETGHASPDMDQLDRTSIRQSLTRYTRVEIHEMLKPGSIFRLECKPSSRDTLEFNIHLKVSGR